MKVCLRCSTEIFTNDTLCPLCDSDMIRRPTKKDKRRLTQKEREEIMRDLGLVKVRGALGGIYFE